MSPRYRNPADGPADEAPGHDTATLDQGPAAPALRRGLTPRQVAGLLRVGIDKVLGWIKRGELDAVNTADVQASRPRYVVLPDALQAFARQRSAAQSARQPRRRKLRRDWKDYYPD